MIKITDTLSISESAIQVDYIQASGPGGQNVNKIASQAQLRFNILTSGLPEDVQVRLIKLAGKRITLDGDLLIQARRYRTQEQNRQDALERLVDLIRRASAPPKERHKTRPSIQARRRRLDHKRQRGDIKRLRQSTRDWE